MQNSERSLPEWASLVIQHGIKLLTFHNFHWDQTQPAEYEVPLKKINPEY